MKIEMNIEKKHLYLITAILLVLLGIFFVQAYGTQDPQALGHTASEINPQTFGTGGSASAPYIFLNPVKITPFLTLGEPNTPGKEGAILFAGSSSGKNLEIVNLGGLGIFQFKDDMNPHFFSDLHGITLPATHKIFFPISDTPGSESLTISSSDSSPKLRIADNAGNALLTVNKDGNVDIDNGDLKIYNNKNLCFVGTNGCRNSWPSASGVVTRFVLSDCSESTRQCPSGYAEVSRFHVGSGTSACTYTQYSDDQGARKAGWVALCVLNT